MSHIFFVLVAVTSSACGSGEVQGAGGSGDGAFGAGDDWRESAECASDRECDDGLYCNGSEKCDEGYCRAGTVVTCGDSVDCTRDACDESIDQCQHTPNHAACDEGVCDEARGCGEGEACTVDDDCDDAVFCNGIERCGDGGACERGEPVACDDGNDCTVDQCSEEGRLCRHDMRDADNDGHADAACRGGDDCDDDDRGVRPGAREVCDDGVDNDCDRARDCSDPTCDDDSACNDDIERDRDRADRDDRDDRVDPDRRDDRDRADPDRRGDRNADPCLQNGWYNDGECDNVCARRDPDCDRRQDSCEDRRWYQDGICDDACRRQDPDCPNRNDDGCRFANDGRCDEPSGRCAAGTDTTDCRPDQARRGADSCRYANDRVCDERTYCLRGTDGRDCTDGGPNSCYFANDGVCNQPPTCMANTDQDDCGAGQNGGARRGETGLGSCGGLTYQGRCVDTDTIEYCMHKGTAQERVATTNCTTGNECRWENAQNGYMCLAPVRDGGAANGDAQRAEPDSWICSAAFYGVGDDCDCNCGAYDPDCDSPWLRILNCGDGQTCGDDGECEGEIDGRVPNAWSCLDSWYDADDGCDCNCGMKDPDCDDADARLYHCEAGQTCNSVGRCVGEVEDEIEAPDGWACPDSFYGTDDGCDCNCGLSDPDCSVSECDDGDVDDETNAPVAWSCQDSWYDNDDGCDCNCGAYDPDCDDAGATLYRCEEGQYCGYDGECHDDEGQWI
jgi:hypothetical protein